MNEKNVGNMTPQKWLELHNKAAKLYFLRMSEYLKPAAAVILPNLGGIAGGFITKRAIPNWYEVRLKSIKQLPLTQTDNDMHFTNFLVCDYKLLYRKQRLESVVI